RDTLGYQTRLNSLAYGWPRAITVRESALNASLIHNTIRVELAGIVIGAATGRWSIDGPLTSANNVTIRQNNVSNVDTGIVIGNVSGTQIENTTFSSVALPELRRKGETGPPHDLRHVHLASTTRDGHP